MYDILASNKFKKDLKLLIKRGYNNLVPKKQAISL